MASIAKDGILGLESKKIELVSQFLAIHPPNGKARIAKIAIIKGIPRIAKCAVKNI